MFLNYPTSKEYFKHFYDEQLHLKTFFLSKIIHNTFKGNLLNFQIKPPFPQVISIFLCLAKFLYKASLNCLNIDLLRSFFISKAF